MPISVALRVFVARDTRERRVVGGVHVTISAGVPFAVVSARVDREPGVIERGSCPGCRRVARGAGGWELRCCMVRVGSPGVIGLMTRVAIRRRTRVDIVDVTLGAGHRGMRAGERECRLAVIEYSPCP